MEAALIRLKQRNDELTAKLRDQPDGQPQATPSPTTMQSQAEFEQITDQLQHQTLEHNERIVEMVSQGLFSYNLFIWCRFTYPIYLSVPFCISVSKQTRSVFDIFKPFSSIFKSN